MPRKGENIYRRKDGRWEGRYVKGRSKEGKALYGYVYGKTYAAVKKKRLERLSEVSNSGSILMKADLSDEDFHFSVLSDHWLESIRPQIKQSTYNKYQNLIHSYIISELNEIRVSELTAEVLQSRCNHLLEHGGEKGCGLSTKTVGDTVLACSYSKLAVAGDPYAVIYSSKDCFRHDGIPPASILDRSWTGKQFHIWKKKFYKCVLLKVYGPSTEEFPLYFC